MDSTIAGAPSVLYLSEDQDMTAHTPLEEHVQSTITWLSKTARGMVNKPEGVFVEGFIFDDYVRLDLRVHHEDMGQIVGKRGRSAQSLRALLMAIGRNRGIQYRLNILE